MTEKSHLLIPLECSICTESISDPRALPCGHSFCGPIRSCLRSMQVDDVIKCAVCRADHKLSADDLKPLYGIKDFFSTKTVEDIDINENVCEKHGKSVTLWCFKCQEMQCNDCGIIGHKNHLVKQLTESILKRIIERKYGKNIKDALKTQKNKMEKSIANIRDEIGRLTATHINNSNHFEELEHRRDFVDLCLERLNDEALQPSEKMNLLIRVAKMDPHLPKCTDYHYVSTQTEKVARASIGIQTDGKASKPPGPIFPEATQQSSFAMMWFTFIQAITFLCDVFWRSAMYIQSHFGTHNKNFTSYAVELWILKRKPVTFNVVDVVIGCFKMQIEAVVAKRSSSSQRMFNIVLSCDKSCSISKPVKIPISFVLVNSQEPMFISMQTVLQYPQDKKRCFELIPYNEIADPRRGWQNDGSFHGLLHVFNFHD